MKKIIFAAVIAIGLTACSNNPTTAEAPKKDTIKADTAKVEAPVVAPESDVVK